MTRPRRLRRALTFVTAALLAGAGVLAVSQPAVAETSSGVNVNIAAGDPVCTGDNAAAVTVTATLDSSTPGPYPTGTPLEIYVNRILYDGTPEAQIDSYGGTTGADGTYTVAVPLASDTSTVIQYGVKYNGDAHFYGDPEYTFPDACRSTPVQGLTTKAWNLTASAGADGGTSISFNYALRDGFTDGWVYPYVYPGTDVDHGGYLFTDTLHLTAPGDQAYTHTLDLAPGDYTLRVIGNVECGGDCNGELPIADNYHFTVPTSTPTPTPTPSPTATLPSTGPSTPTASLSTTTVAPDGRVTVTASGLAPSEPVELWLHSTPIKLWSGTANADGTLTQTVTIPTGIDIGKHQVEVRGATTGSLWLDLTVTATLAATGFDPVAAGVGGGAGLLLSAGGIATLLLARRRRVLRS
ncbi:hypothetical protein [Microbacterium sp. B24]|uniref:hypothetical protein n=1 Tax=Microbacterium sp. B24 TaxID=95616 RepID=UPI00041D264D|nr:hypothetical protein [Microbacterium sp. B24]